jgi:hypothetical protein
MDKAKAEAVGSREDLVRFLRDLSAEVEAGDVRTTNRSPAAILEAASAWLQDMDGFFINHGKEPPTEPSWELIAHTFAASLLYE